MSSTKSTKTKDYFYQICKTIYYFGGSNYYFEELDLPKTVKTIQYVIARICEVLAIFFMLFELPAFATQKNLSEKERADLVILCFSHPIIWSFFVSVNYYYTNDVRQVIFMLTEKTKRLFNDEEVEEKMLDRAKFFTNLCLILSSSCMLFYAVDALIQVFYADGTFVTVITAWPDVGEKTTIANIARVTFYIMWWVFMLRIFTIYMCVIPLSVCLSHQYTHLCRYFVSLDKIFYEKLSDDQKEVKYENAFKAGLVAHADTIWCTKQFQKIFGITFGGQILVNITVLVLLLVQTVTAERTLANALATFSTASAMLISTGCLMWNAGDIPVEASKVATAMFSSGWNHCRRPALMRMRSSILIAMRQSQQPMELKCLGVVQLSYDSYVQIVKTSYSVFSVLNSV